MKLGFWQLDRLEWKTDILNRIAINMAAEPVPLDAITDPSQHEYSRVCATGHFSHDHELYYFTTNLQGQAGYNIYTPLIRDHGAPVIVNRGWVPTQLKNPENRKEGQSAGEVTVCGVLRVEGKPGWFMPDNDVRGNVWTHRDLKAMAEAAKIAAPYPAFIDADATENPGGFPIGGQTRVDIPNNHLGYAITWFGMAIALLVIFVIFAVKARRES